MTPAQSCRPNASRAAWRACDHQRRRHGGFEGAAFGGDGLVDGVGGPSPAARRLEHRHPRAEKAGRLGPEHVVRHQGPVPRDQRVEGREAGRRRRRAFGGSRGAVGANPDRERRRCGGGLLERRWRRGGKSGDRQRRLHRRGGAWGGTHFHDDGRLQLPGERRHSSLEVGVLLGPSLDERLFPPDRHDGQGRFEALEGLLVEAHLHLRHAEPVVRVVAPREEAGGRALLVGRLARPLQRRPHLLGAFRVLSGPDEADPVGEEVRGLLVAPVCRHGESDQQHREDRRKPGSVLDRAGSSRHVGSEEF